MGIIGNVLTVAGIAAFLSMHPPRRLFQVVLGTTVQRLMALFIIGISLSLLNAEPDFATLVTFFKRITLLFIVAAVVYGFREGEGIRTLGWVTLAAVTLAYAMSEIAFYFGENTVPFSGEIGGGLVEVIRRGQDLSTYTGKLAPLGTSMSVNRFAFMAILPFSLAIGLLISGRQTRSAYFLPIASLIILGGGVFIIASRSGSVALVISVGIILFFLGQTRRRLPAAATLSVLILGGMWALQFLPAGVTSYDRFFSNDRPASDGYTGYGTRIDDGRLEMWKLGLEMFSEGPATGVGLRRFREEAENRLPQSTTFDSHSSFIQVAAEAGILGIGPLALLLIYVFFVLLRPGKRLPDDLRLWSLVFLGALLGMSFSAMFNDYIFDRYYWIPIAFVATIEAVGRNRARRPLPEPSRADGPAPLHRVDR